MSGEENKIKLLIVDDEEDFLTSISERLGMREFDVTTATEGRLAIEAANKGTFDVALLDMKMPGMDGMELFKILKKRHKFLEVIILTGFGAIDSAVEATKLGAYSYMEKPFDFEKLMEAIKKAYEARLRKKFEQDKKRMEKIDKLSKGSSPLSILRALVDMDDDEK